MCVTETCSKLHRKSLHCGTTSFTAHVVSTSDPTELMKSEEVLLLTQIISSREDALKFLDDDATTWSGSETIQKLCHLPSGGGGGFKQKDDNVRHTREM